MTMRYLQIAAVAALVMGGSTAACRAAEASSRDATVRYAQMNSPGDGLDRGAASQGNARPNRRGNARKTTGRRMR